MTSRLSAAAAVLRVCKLLDLPVSSSGQAWYVRRLDAEPAYFLVHVAERVACIDAIHGDLLVAATSSHSPLSVGREQALTVAGFDAVQTAELVWKPCAASMSQFYPLWLVADAEHSLFIDQNGQIWPTLPAKRPGG